MSLVTEIFCYYSIREAQYKKKQQSVNLLLYALLLYV